MADLIAELEGVVLACDDAQGHAPSSDTELLLRHFIRTRHPEIAAAVRDSRRIDWLADPENKVGNVQLPSECVLANPHSLRAAIDTAMRAGEGEG